MTDQNPENTKAGEFVTIPADMPDDRDALDALEQEVRDRYAEIRQEAGNAPTAEQIDEMEALAEAIDKIEAKRAELDAAEEEAEETAAARAERLAALDGRFAAQADDTADEAPEAPQDAAEAPEAPKVDGEPVVPQKADDEPGEDTADDDDADGEDDADDENTTTDGDDADDDEENNDMGKTKFGGAARGTVNADEQKKAEGIFTLDRAVPNYTPGPVGLLDAAKAFEEIASGRALVASGEGRTVSAQFAHIKRDLPDDLIVTDERSAGDVLDRAVDETRLPGNSLTAAAGWCAPSTTIYDFLDTDPATNLYSLPEISVARGGVRFPVEPDMSALYALDNFLWTEADAIAGNKTKTCVEIPCPEMEETRLDAIWTCVTSNLLANKGWPEMTAKFLREAARAHLHRISAYRLRKVVDGSDAVNFTTGPFSSTSGYGAAGTVLSGLALQAADLRAKHRLAETRTIEVIVPSWLKEALRADLAFRDEVLPDDVNDARLTQWFTTRGMSVQYVADWQNEIIGSATSAATAYPASVKALMYPAGTWWSAVEPVINLGATYDSTGLSKNQRTEMFVEDGVGVGKRGYESRLIDVPLTINGGVGPRVGSAAGAGA